MNWLANFALNEPTEVEVTKALMQVGPELKISPAGSDELVKERLVCSSMLCHAGMGVCRRESTPCSG